MTRIMLVRHGQSEWNAVGRWQGQADPPLSDLGRHQAALAARRLSSLAAVVSSDLQRATETAEIIAEAVGVGPVSIDPDLRERDAGEWSGLTRDEIRARWPGYLPEDRSHAAFQPGPRRRPPGWEPDASLLARALAAVGRIAADAPGADVVAVTHGGLVYVLEEHLGDGGAGRLANLAGRWIFVRGGTLSLGRRVLLVDDDAVTVPGQI